MLLMFCRKNKDSKKGWNPSEGFSLIFYIVKKLLADSNNKISIFNETTNQMKERKTIIYNLREVAYSFKNGLNTMFSPIFSYLEYIQP